MSNDVTTEKQNAELSADDSADGVSVHKKNLALKKELWGRGYYVNDVGQDGEIDYLVVPTAQPKDAMKVNISDWLKS